MFLKINHHRLNKLIITPSQHWHNQSTIALNKLPKNLQNLKIRRLLQPLHKTRLSKLPSNHKIPLLMFKPLNQFKTKHNRYKNPNQLKIKLSNLRSKLNSLIKIRRSKLLLKNNKNLKIR
jgi:hypothetical protein